VARDARRVVRQQHGIPTILQKWAAPIRRELIKIRAAIESGKIRIPMKRADAKPLKKKDDLRILARVHAAGEGGMLYAFNRGADTRHGHSPRLNGVPTGMQTR
jgi:hypothetical protein